MTHINDSDSALDDASERFALLDLDFDRAPAVEVRRCPKCTSILAGVRMPVSPVDGWCRLCDRSRPLQPTSNRAAVATAIAIPGTAPAVATGAVIAAILAGDADAPLAVVPESTAAQPGPIVDPVPVADLDDAAPALPSEVAFLAAAIDEGATMAAQANLVRGGVPRENVNSYAGFQAGAGLTAAQATDAASLSAASNRTLGGTGGPAVAITAPAQASGWIPSTPLAADLPSPLRAAIVAARARRGITTANLTPQQRARVEAQAQRERQRAAIESAIQVALTATGDNADYPHGLLAAWRPAGERSYSAICEIATAANSTLGVSEDDRLMGRYVTAPAKRSLRAVAADAVRGLERRGYRVAVIRNGSAWTVYRPADLVTVGQSVGEASLVARFQDDDLKLEGPEDLCAVVRGAFTHAQDHAMLGSTEITAWLSDNCRRLLAVWTAYGRWIAPGRASEVWRALATAANSGGLPVPARPAAVASRADIADEIRVGILAEIDTMVTTLRAARDAARGKVGPDGKPGDIGVRAAITALDDIAAARAKLATYEGLIGEMTDARTALTALEIEYAPYVDGTSQRGAMLEMY